MKNLRKKMKAYVFFRDGYVSFSYENNHYYWAGHHVNTTEKPYKCDYQITYEDMELRHVSCFQIFFFHIYSTFFR